MNARSGPFWLVASTVLAAALLVVAPVAQGRGDAARSARVSLSLSVNFSYSGAAAVTLPDGTPVGTTSGAPTVIPAGFYSIELQQPGCTAVPLFTLTGPGVHIENNLEGGELTNESADADFQPNSTYTWKIDTAPDVIHTFVTNGQVLGTPPPPANVIVGQLDPYTGKTKAQTGNTSIVGSGITPFRGKLTGAVTASGRLSLSLAGKRVAHLRAGRYAIAVTDRSRRSGFLLEHAKHARVTVTGIAFVGRRSVSVNLVAGRWTLASGSGKTRALVVS